MTFPRILTSHDRRPVSVRDFATGAIGNGENADAAIAAAQVEARAWGRPLHFPTGRYVTTTAIEIDDANAGDINTGVYGEQNTYDTVGTVATRNTIIEYAGTGGNILRVRSRGVRIQDLALRVQSGKSADAGIVWDKNTQTATRMEVINCQILAGAAQGLGTCTDGYVIGPTSGINNLDYSTVDRCYFVGFTDAAINIKSDTGQSKGHHFSNSVLGVAAYGIKTTSGSFVGFNLHVGYATTASIGIGASTDFISVTGLDSENSACALKNIGGYYLPWPVRLSGGRWSLSDTAATHYVDWAYSQLILENVLFDYAGTFDPTTRGLVRVGGKYNASNNVAAIISSGNQYLNSMPWRVSSGGGTPAYVDVSTHGDYWREYTGSGPYSWSGRTPPIRSTPCLRVDTTGASKDRAINRFAPGDESFGTDEWHIQYGERQLDDAEELTLSGNAEYVITDL